MNQLIKQGDRSDQVEDVQARLRALGFRIEDDPATFGDSTHLAVRTFQQSRAILVDGIVGPQTWQHLVEASWRLGDRTLYVKFPPMRGDDVTTLQTRLNALGFDAGREDGIFGPLAHEAVREFQKEYGVLEDGMFGRRTLEALEGLRVDRPGTAARIREDLRARRKDGLTGALVMLDPGHGGSDPGEAGSFGAVERDVCWSLATLVAERLSASGARVRLTRSEPEDPDESERARRANETGADLFISLHLNAHREPTAEGACAYYFGSSAAGHRLAEALQDRLISLGARDCRVHARSYPLLRETRMPAVLVEPAFITNPDEEKQLYENDHRVAIADALAHGVRDYFDSLV